jgi:hypothetical protein
VSVEKHFYQIADFGIELSFANTEVNSTKLLPSFEPFEIKLEENNAEPKEESWQPLFTLNVDDTLAPYPKDRRERIRVFDTGNGDTVVDLLDNGGYQYIIRDLKNADCCLLQTNKLFSECRCALNGNFNMRSFGLNNALMLAFAFAASRHQTIMIHASLVRQGGYGYPFIAKSGTGKSTHTSLWMKHLPGCDLMNDDNPIVRICNDTPYIYGSPWSGKTPCYRNVKAPLGAITRIDRAQANSIERLKPLEAFASVLPAASAMKWDEDIFNHICKVVTKLIETTPIYTLHCLPNKEAAELCNQTIARNRQTVKA